MRKPRPEPEQGMEKFSKHEIEHLANRLMFADEAGSGMSFVADDDCTTVAHALLAQQQEIARLKAELAESVQAQKVLSRQLEKRAGGRDELTQGLTARIAELEQERKLRKEAEAQLTALREENEQAHELLRAAIEDYNDELNSHRALQSALTRVVEYVQHKPKCPKHLQVRFAPEPGWVSSSYTKPCNCGLDDQLAALTAARQEQK